MGNMKPPRNTTKPPGSKPPIGAKRMRLGNLVLKAEGRWQTLRPLVKTVGLFAFLPFFRWAWHVMCVSLSVGQGKTLQSFSLGLWLVY